MTLRIGRAVLPAPLPATAPLPAFAPAPPVPPPPVAERPGGAPRRFKVGQETLHAVAGGEKPAVGPARPFLPANDAKALLGALREAAQGAGPAALEGLIAQAEGLRRDYDLPRDARGEASALLNALRAAKDSATERGMDGPTAEALVRALRALPATRREEIEGVASQLCGLMAHVLPPRARHAAERTVVSLEAALGRLPPNPAERARIEELDWLLTGTGGNGSETLRRARTLAEAPVLHPLLRQAACRAAAILDTGSDGVLRNNWESPARWRLDPPRLGRSVLRQAEALLAELASGNPDSLLLRRLGGDPARLHRFAAELAERAPHPSRLHRLAELVRDEAERAARRPGPDDEVLRDLLKHMTYLSQVRL